MSNTDLLNGYDMVVALSQNFLNSQLTAICQNPNSKPPPPNQKPNYSIFDNFTIQLDPTAEAGTPAAWNSVIVTQMNSPTIAIGENNTVVLTLHITEGTVQYVDMSAQQQTASLANTDVSFTVNMSLAVISDPNNLAAPQNAINQLNGFSTSDFTIQFLALEFESASMISSCDVSSPNFTKNSRQYIVLLNCLNAYLGGNSANPYILGYPIQSVNPAETNPNLPAFAPTSCEFSTTVNADNAGLSTLNYCLMTQDRPFPTGASSGVFDTPWLTDSSESGMLTISHDVFVNGYLVPLVLPQIADALNITGADWTSDSAGWHLNYEDTNKNDNNGKGDLINVPKGLDYYKLYDYTISCDVSLSNVNGNMTITADCNFDYKGEVNVQMQLTNWVKAEVTQTMTLTLTFTAGNDGKFVIIPNITKGTPNKKTQLGAAAKVGQAVVDVWNGITGGNDNPYDQLQDNLQTSENDLIADFTNQIGADMSVLSNQFVLPAASVFNYNGLAFNSEQDMQVSIANAA